MSHQHIFRGDWDFLVLIPLGFPDVGIFIDVKQNIPVDLKFALPGKERQDSVYNGLQVCLWFLLTPAMLALSHILVVCASYLVSDCC